MRCRIPHPPPGMTKDREEELLARIQEIFSTYQSERDQRKAFARSCGTVQERKALITHHNFREDPNIILNRRSRLGSKVVLDVNDWKDLHRWAVYFEDSNNDEVHVNLVVHKPTPRETRLFIDVPVTAVKFFRKSAIEGDAMEGRILWESKNYNMMDFQILLSSIAPPNHSVSLEFCIVSVTELYNRLTTTRNVDDTNVSSVTY